MLQCGRKVALLGKLMTFSISKSLLTLTLGTGILFTTQLAARASTKFVCEDINNVPTTVAHTPNGKIPVIGWSSNYFAEDGYTPEVRCKQVSARFQLYYKDGSLKYLTTGLINKQPVICTAEHINGECKNLLFTLKLGTDPSKALKDLFNVRERARGPLYESGNRAIVPLNKTESRIYIDVDKLLNSNTNNYTEENSKSKSVKEQTAW